MIALLLCGLIAGACAAPQFDFSFGSPRMPQPFFSDYHKRHPNIDENVFDTGRVWSDLSKEITELDDMLNDYDSDLEHAGSSVSQKGVEGTEYRVSISLPEFDEKDIIVKARGGLLMILANHKYTEGSERYYVDVRTLPDNVNVTGNWVFENGVLKITFPLKGGVVVKPTKSQFDMTVKPYFPGSREEIESTGNEGIQGADVGLGRGDQGEGVELKTNEIPDRSTVEATTYAVDLKDEIEFVPFRY